jgi:thiamine-phosphate pyrophosphorylase
LLLYYITDRRQFPGGEAEQRHRLLEKIAEAARAGIEFIQLREKDLAAGVLERLARDAVRVVRENSGTTKLLINSRLDIALACGADGVHLTSTDIPASDARAIAASAKRGATPEAFTVAVSTHTRKEVEDAYAHGANLVVFGPVFEKQAVAAHQGIGLEELRLACNMPTIKDQSFQIFALGGITLANAQACLAAGAAGVAAIRLFQENEVASVVEKLRAATSH